MQHPSCSHVRLIGLVLSLVGVAPGSAQHASTIEPDASFLGEHAGDSAGRALAFAGDVNNDGYDDFLVGCGNSDQAGENAGKAYLVLGSDSGWGADVPLSDAHASFVGLGDGDMAGLTVAGIGDVNGDGFDDFAVGAPHNNTAADDAGAVYVLFGKPAGWTAGVSLAAADASFLGEHAGDEAGGAIAGAGDVNNDGFDDFVIGAKHNGDAGEQAGKVYLILGRASGWAADTPLLDADASFLGEHDHDKAGESLAGVGDVNGDGFADFVIGAPDNGETGAVAGKVYLILGRPIGWATGASLAASAASFRGERTGDSAGRAVAGVGDVNSDGYGDFVVGAPGNDDGGATAGKLYLLLGSPAAWVSNTSLTSANASFLGEHAGDMAGGSVAGAGDVNGDGCDDFLAGSTGNDEEGDNAGKLYVILGRASGWSWMVDLADADSSYPGEAAGDRLGACVFGGGDFNNDGRSDFGGGAPEDDTNGGNAGKVHILFGGGGKRIVSWQEVSPASP